MSSPQPELSQRQQQILKLLQEGKVNKAVAQELGIGLGTVKQHIVALFKKLKVSNRAMAVSQGMELIKGHQSRPAVLPMSDLLEQRPCVVLSIALPADAGQRSVKLMYGCLAAGASANDAVFLARNNNAGDIVFGIQRVTEYDPAVALQVAGNLYDELLETDAEAAHALRGCMTAGVALASMQRFGGWTGEAVASAAIASARELLHEVPAGRFRFDSAALDLIELNGIGGDRELSSVIGFSEVQKMYWTGARPAYQLLGRDDELARLNAALTEAGKGKGRFILVKGEMGMGKSSLCAAIARTCLQQEGKVSYWRCLPPALGSALFDTADETACSVEQVVAALCAEPVCRPEIVVVDDVNLLAVEQQKLLAAAVGTAVEHGKMVIYSGRAGLRDRLEIPAETISLCRLPASEMQTLVRSVLGKGNVRERARKVQQIAAAAAGVPLFAVALARHHDQALALPLRVAINARLDSLRLDRTLLREVAKKVAGAHLEEVAVTLGEELETVRPQMERAVASGVLTYNDEKRLTFTHPLLRMAIANLQMEPA